MFDVWNPTLRSYCLEFSQSLQALKSGAVEDDVGGRRLQG